MPPPGLWQTFFEPKEILSKLGLITQFDHVVEFGCGYGTFTTPRAQIVNGRVSTFDLDEQMIAHARGQLPAEILNKVQFHHLDFCFATQVLGKSIADYVMLFNILHGEEPIRLLEQAFDLLCPEGRAGIIHWNYDPDTPRGPPMDIRPQPEELADLAHGAGFMVSEMIDLPPFHYGFQLQKPPS
ncbi:MAG: class I SAM-dependent methyltransferase [Pseudomonadota bacterium]